MYLWLTYRPELAVSYDDLHAQLGSHYQADDRGELTPYGKKEFGRAVSSPAIPFTTSASDRLSVSSWRFQSATRSIWAYVTPLVS